MLDLLLSFLPGALAAAVQAGVLGLASALVVVLLFRRLTSRKALSIRNWGTPAGGRKKEGRLLADRLRNRMEAIWAAHRNRTGLTSSGESTSLGNPRRESEDLGSRVVSLLAENSPVGFLVNLSSKIWPALELEGEIVPGEGGRRFCGARLKKGQEYFVSWRIPLEEGGGGTRAGEDGGHAPEARMVKGPAPGDGPEGGSSQEAGLVEGHAWVAGLVDEMAHRIVLDAARQGILGPSGRPGTGDWRAFRSLTRALALWNAPDFHLAREEEVEGVMAHLTEAIRLDPGYVLAWLNRGTLRLLTFRDASTNREAREDFERAEVLARDGRSRVEEGSSGTRDPTAGVWTHWARLEGLAALGIARTLSQDRHRYGIRDADRVKEAREAAGHAVTLLNRSAESLYALAFAWHCTETLEDIEKGIEFYREIIRREPRKHPGVHNNLGYILMVGGERLRDRGDEGGAREWWKRAEKEIRLTLKISDETRVTTPFSRANLGNLHRLRGRYAEAEREYLRALGPDPRESRYTNGLNELARLYVEMGRTEDAHAFHALALASTDDSNQRRKLEEDFALARAPTQAPG